jgi:NTE family protein
MIANDVSGPLGFPLALLNTLINGYDRYHLNDPAAIDRTIFIDAAKIKATNFSITTEQQTLLCKNGQEAAEQFLKQWNFDTYIKKYVKPEFRATKRLLQARDNKTQ